MEYIHIGKLGKTFGLDLQLRLALKTEMHDVWYTILQLNQAVYVGIDGFKIPFFIHSYDDAKDLVKFNKVEDENLVKEMSGCEIYVAQSQEIQDQIFDVDVFVSLEIIDNNTNKGIGLIDRIEEYPAHPMAILIKDKQEIMIPIVEEWIVEVRQEQRQLVMDLPDGLLDG